MAELQVRYSCWTEKQLVKSKLLQASKRTLHQICHALSPNKNLAQHEMSQLWPCCLTKHTQCYIIKTAVFEMKASKEWPFALNELLHRMLVHSAMGKVPVQRFEQWPIRLGQHSVAPYGDVVFEFFQQQRKQVGLPATAEVCPVTAFEVSIAEVKHEKQRRVRQGEGSEVFFKQLGTS